MQTLKPLMMICCGVILLLSPVLWLVWPHAPHLSKRMRGCMRQWQRSLPPPRNLPPRMLIVISLLLLSGCGTAPLPVHIQRPVPAALLVPPRRPTLLVPKTQASPYATPGTTTPSTPKAAPKTASDTKP